MNAQQHTSSLGHLPIHIFVVSSLVSNKSHSESEALINDKEK